MSMHQQLTTTTLIRGIFFMILGSALLLNTIAPSSFLQHFLTLTILLGSLLMIGYGAVLLRLHVLLGHLIATWTDEDNNKR